MSPKEIRAYVQAQGIDGPCPLLLHHRPPWLNARHGGHRMKGRCPGTGCGGRIGKIHRCTESPNARQSRASTETRVDKRLAVSRKRRTLDMTSEWGRPLGSQGAGAGQRRKGQIWRQRWARRSISDLAARRDGHRGRVTALRFGQRPPD